MTILLPRFEDEPAWLAQSGAPSTRTTTWLHSAWEEQVHAQLFRGALKCAEDARDKALALALRDGIGAIDVGHGTVRTVVRPRTRTRVLDLEGFKTAYPDAFRKVARQSVRIADAEREVGKDAVAEFCSILEGSERAGLVYEPASDPFVDEEAEP